jgi:hypothetical protein
MALLFVTMLSCNKSKLLNEPVSQGHLNEEVKFQYIVYTSELELFAEADAFVVGEIANVLSHFSFLPEFKLVEQGSIYKDKAIIGLKIKGETLLAFFKDESPIDKYYSKQ